jgi:hypothetical protein
VRKAFKKKRAHAKQTYAVAELETFAALRFGHVVGVAHQAARRADRIAQPELARNGLRAR